MLADISASTSPLSTRSATLPPPAKRLSETLPERLVEVVRADPFATIRELRDQLRAGHPEDARISWWTVFRLLLNEQLLSRRARFRLARGRRSSE